MISSLSDRFVGPPAVASCRVLGAGLLWLLWLLAMGGCSTLTQRGRPASTLAIRQDGGGQWPQAAWIEGLLWPGRAEWRDWGHANLQSGDLVFVRSNYYMMLGTFNLSRFLAEVGQSPFSHVGLVVVEADGQVMVYDVTDRGIQSQPFATFVTADAKQRLAVRRPVGQAQEAVAAAIQYVRDKQQAGTPFDRRFQPGDDRLYCTELIVEAYRRGGIELTAATAAGELPGLDQVSATELQWVRWATALKDGDKIVLPGNEQTGLYASPWLRPVLEPMEL